MFLHSSFQTAGANPGSRTVSLDLPELFKHPLSKSAIDALLDPAGHTGLSASIAHQQAEVARRFASELHAYLQS